MCVFKRTVLRQFHLIHTAKLILNASMFSLTWIRSYLEDPYLCSAANSVHTGPRTQITTSFAILCSFQRSSVSIWVLQLKNQCRTLESRCYTSLVRGTLRICVQNSLFCMSATSNTFYVELRSYHVSWTEAQQTLSRYQSAENHQRFLMEERTQEQVLATEARSLWWIYLFGDSEGARQGPRAWTRLNVSVQNKSRPRGVRLQRPKGSAEVKEMNKLQGFWHDKIRKTYETIRKTYEILTKNHTKYKILTKNHTKYKIRS